VLVDRAQGFDRVSTESRICLVNPASGHGFSRAAQRPKTAGLLAPEGFRFAKARWLSVKWGKEKFNACRQRLVRDSPARELGIAQPSRDVDRRNKSLPVH